MKLIALILLAASSSYAADARPLEYNFVCRSEGHLNKPITQIRLKNLTTGIVKEGVKVPFELKVETLQARTREVVQVFTYRGLLETEDVHLFFNSLDKKVNLNMYLDELEATTLTIKGQKPVDLICDEHRW